MIQSRRGTTAADYVPAFSDLLSLDQTEIWGGPQLIRIRDEMKQRLQHPGTRSVTIDISSVKHLPSGFFGLLHDLRDHGLDVKLLGVQDPIAAMEWFRRFFEACPEAEPNYRLHRFRKDPIYIVE